MKRAITGILAVLLVWNLSGCRGGGVTENAVVDLGTSEQFSQAELESAVECLKTYFHSGSFYDCTMEEIWYDEEDSKRCAASYLAGANREVADGITAENVISLFGTFTTGADPNKSFSPYATYPYRWLMIRDRADSPWRMDMRGSGQG